MRMILFYLENTRIDMAKNRGRMLVIINAKQVQCFVIVSDMGNATNPEPAPSRCLFKIPEPAVDGYHEPLEPAVG